MEEEVFINPNCLVNCHGCNASMCCWDMAREDFEEGRQCNCTVFEEYDREGQPVG